MTRRALKFQRDLAHRLGIRIDRSSFAVAAAQIEEAVSPALYLEPDRDPATKRQIEYAQSFGIDVSKDSKGVASAKIQVQQDSRNKVLIEKMRLAPGSVVVWKWNQRTMVISSIADNGRIWFKGGNGCGRFRTRSSRPRPKKGIVATGPPLLLPSICPALECHRWTAQRCVVPHRLEDVVNSLAKPSYFEIPENRGFGTAPAWPKSSS